MRLSLLMVMSILCFSCIASYTQADDSIFTSTTALKEEVQRIGNEGLEVMETPIDVKNDGLISTLAVAGAVGLTYIFDNDIRNKLQGTKSSAANKATDAGDVIGNPFVHLGVASAVYVGGVLADSPKWQEAGEMLGEAAMLADGAGFILKSSIGRARPFVKGDKGNFQPFQLKSDYDSMPSLHTASSFAMASVMSSLSDNILAKISYYSAATFVGFSRMYQDNHWASDVVLGAAIGELCGQVVTRYHSSHGNIALAPMLSGNSASLHLVGSW